MTEPISDEALVPIAAAVAHAIEGLGVIPMVQSFDRVADMHVALSPQGMAGILARLTAAEAENTRLRAALAQSDRPCVYCTLPADEWSKCAQGFPGCDRADDAMGCPHLGASIERDRLRKALEEAKERLALELVREEYDYPGDAAEYCGLHCRMCGEGIAEDGLTGHLLDCPLYGVQRAALSPEPSGDPA
jgi:hypothetical protein